LKAYLLLKTSLSDLKNILLSLSQDFESLPKKVYTNWTITTEKYVLKYSPSIFPKIWYEKFVNEEYNYNYKTNNTFELFIDNCKISFTWDNVSDEYLNEILNFIHSLKPVRGQKQYMSSITEFYMSFKKGDFVIEQSYLIQKTRHIYLKTSHLSAILFYKVDDKFSKFPLWYSGYFIKENQVNPFYILLTNEIRNQLIQRLLLESIIS
jgi:hypothetical protein